MSDLCIDCDMPITRKSKKGRCRPCNNRTPESRSAAARGSYNQPREAKVRGAYIAGRIAVKSGQIIHISTPESCAKGGRIQGRIAVESGQLASIRTPESCAKGGRIGGRKNVESGHIASLGRIYGRVALESGRLAKGGTKTIEIHRRKKPNRQEATVAALLMTFHPDVWDDIIWQRHLPNGLRGVPDLRHPIKVIGEYDGDGHHLFKDRSADDAAKDIERRAVGYAVIRETDPFVLVAKFAYAVRATLSRP